MLHLLVYISDTKDDRRVIVLHTGRLRGDVADPVFNNQAVRNDKGSVPVQSRHKVPAFQCLEHAVQVIGMHMGLDLLLACLKKVPAAPHFLKAAFIARAIMDVPLRVGVDVKKIRVSACQRLGDVGVDDGSAPFLLISFFGHNARALDAHHVRHIPAYAEDAQLPVKVVVFQFCSLQLPWFSGGIRHVLKENVGLIHGQGHPVVLNKMLRRLGIENPCIREPGHAFRIFLMSVLRKGPVAGQIDSRLRILRENHSGHIVQKSDDGFLHFCVLRGILHAVPVFFLFMVDHKRMEQADSKHVAGRIERKRREPQLAKQEDSHEQPKENQSRSLSFQTAHPQGG